MNKILKRLTRGRKTLVVAVVCAAIIVQTIMPIFDISGIWAANVTPTDSIQDIIDDSNGDNTITLSPGTFNEQIIINRDITITGAGKEQTFWEIPDTLNSNSEFGNKSLITITNDANVTIENIGFQDSDSPQDHTPTIPASIIFVGGGSLATIQNNKFTDVFPGTYKSNAITVGFASNPAETSGNAIINKNEFDGYQMNAIVVSNSSSTAQILSNKFDGKNLSRYQNAITVDYGPRGIIIRDNTITNNSRPDYDPNNPQGSPSSAIYFENVNETTKPNFNDISRNTIENNDVGLVINSLDSSGNNVIQNNEIKNNKYGVIIDTLSHSNLSLTSNDISSNTEIGIYYDETTVANQIDATNNYWGDCAGPEDSTDNDGSNPLTNDGSGNPIFGAVNYTGYDQVEQCQTEIESPTEIEFVTNVGEPDEETLTCGAYTDEKEVRVQWNKLENAVEYHYEITYVNPETGEESVWPEPGNPPVVVTTNYRDGSFTSKGEGLRKVRIKAIDAEGNESNWSEPCSIYYTEGPVLTDPNLTLNINGQEVACGTTINTTKEVTVSWTEAENANDYRYAINVTNEEDWYTTIDTEFTHNITEERTYTFYVKARNEVGTTPYNPCTLTYDPAAEDNTPPVVTIDDLTQVQSQSGIELILMATAEDTQSNIKSMRYAIEGWDINGPLSPADGDFNELSEVGTATIDISSLTIGNEYNLAVCGTDAADNEGCTSTRFIVEEPPVGDNQAPIITGKDIALEGDNLYVEATAEDEESPIKTIEYQLLEGWNIKENDLTEVKAGELDTTTSGEYELDNVVTAEKYIDITDVAEGKYTLRICATDTEDNKGSGNHDEIPTVANDECYYEEGYIYHFDDTDAPVITDKLDSRTIKEGEELNDKLTLKDESGIAAICYGLYSFTGNTIIEDCLEVAPSKDFSFPTRKTWTLAEMLDMNKMDTSQIPEGDYYFIYSVADILGNATEGQIVEYTVENVKPSANLKSNYTRVYEYATINFSGSFTDPSSIAENPDDAEWYYTVTYGDGNKYSKSGITNPGNITIPSNKYTTAGTYTAKLTVCEAKKSDNPMSENQCGTDTITIKVYKYTQPNPSQPSEPEQTEKAIVEGYVYEDEDTDQIRSEGEHGVEGIEVSIKQDNNEEIIAITDGSGYWKAEVPEGEAIIEVNALTLPEDATLLNVAQTIEVELGVENVVEFAYTLEDGDVKGENTCDTSEMGTISGFIYNDENKNNSKDEEEKGVEGIKVIIYINEDGQEKIIETVSTDSEGFWEVDVCPGSYRMRVDEESLPNNAEIEKPENTTVISSNQNREINFSYQVKESWFRQNCIWIGLGVLIVVLVFMLGAIILKNSEQANTEQTEY